MNLRVVILCIFLGGLFCSTEIFAQPAGAYDVPGMPYYEIYEPGDYPGEQQNRWIIQEDDYTILVANSGGLLQHGDKHWRLFGNNEISFLSAIKKSQVIDNRVWAGSFSNIGYFESNDTSLYNYHSLTPRLADSLRNFSDVSAIEEFDDYVFFLNDLYLFAYDLNTGETGLAGKIYQEISGSDSDKDAQITQITTWRDRLYVFLDDQTILTLDKNGGTQKITPITDVKFNHIVATETWLRQLILADRNGAVLTLGEDGLSRLKTEADNYLAENKISDIAVFMNGDIAIATDNGGTVVLGIDGSFKYLLAEKTGLRENIHNQLQIDHNQDLWISGNESITKVYSGVPLKQLNGDVFGFGDAVQVYQGEEYFYVGAMNGLYRYKSEKEAVLENNPEDLFTLVDSISSPFWSFKIVDDALWTAGNAGIFEIKETGLIKLFEKKAYFMRYLSESKILIVTSNGVDLVEKIDGNWIDRGQLDAASFYIYAYAVINDTTFWAGGVQEQLAKITYDEKKGQFEQKFYTANDGLLPSDAYEPVFLNGRLIINSNSGYMIYDEEYDRLLPFDGLNRDLGSWGEYLNLDNAGNYWSIYIDDDYRGVAKMMPETDSTWKRTPTVFELSKDHFGDFIDIDDQRIWVGSTESIMYKDLYAQIETSTPSVEIWQVQSLFDQEVLSLGRLPEEVAFQQKQIRVDLTSSSFRYPEKNQYRYRIDDGSWSEWRIHPGIVMDASFPGDYQLEVQTRDFMNQISEPKQFSFAIIAPWYLSYGALAGYGLLFITGIFFSVRGLSGYRIRRELEQVKVEEAEKLIELDAMKSRLFANISHEFRTPLTISHGLVKKSLRERISDEEITLSKRDMMLVNRNLNRLRDMVNQIIDLTKADHDHLKLNRSYYRSDELVTLSVESFRSLAEYRGHHYEVNQQSDDAILFVDRSKVEIIINNLISNAIKFTKGGGQILIKTSVKNNIFHLIVSDTGPGIPEKDKEAIFERFYQIQQQEEEYVEGMGVGLELSRTLARLHNGDLTLLPNRDRGAAFLFTLPVAETDATRPVINIEEADLDELLIEMSSDEKPRNTEKAPHHSGKKLLLIEDNEDMMDYVRGVLSGEAHIQTATNGIEAIDQIKTSPPDLIITDLMMPKMDGIALIEKLSEHKRWKDIPVIVLTAKAIPEQKTELLRIGVVDYITKPFEPDQLMLKVRNMLKYAERRMEIPEPEKEDMAETELLKDHVITYIQENISDPGLNVDKLVAAFPQSRRSFYRNIQSSTGMTPSELIREVRFKRAEYLIQSDRDYSLEELADAVGYKSATSFRKAFEKSYGKHPLE